MEDRRIRKPPLPDSDAVGRKVFDFAMSKKMVRILLCILAVVLLLAAFVSCKPRGTYTNAFGVSYTFSGKHYTHTDSEGNVFRGTFELHDDTIIFITSGDARVPLPYRTEGKDIVIADIVYYKE